MAPGSTFTKVFKRRINKASVKTDKAEEKLLDDNQYTPPPGNIGFIKGLMSNADGSQGAAKFESIGGSRMEEVRTWNHAGEIFSRALDWSGNSFDVGDLSRFNSFQVTTTNKKTSKGYVTIPLHGHLLIFNQRLLMNFIFW